MYSRLCMEYVFELVDEEKDFSEEAFDTEDRDDEELDWNFRKDSVNSSCTNSIFETFFIFRVLLLFVLYDDEEGKEYKSKGCSRLSSQSESERIDDRCSDMISSTLDVLDTSEDDILCVCLVDRERERESVCMSILKFKIKFELETWNPWN